MTSAAQHRRQNILIAVLSAFFVVLLAIGVDRVIAVVGLIAAAVLTVIVARQRRQERSAR
jgi:membrane associated rhomboid family serine protease